MTQILINGRPFWVALSHSLLLHLTPLEPFRLGTVDCSNQNERHECFVRNAFLASHVCLFLFEAFV